MARLSCILLLCAMQLVGADISDCSHTFAGGQTFDLTGLRKPEGEPDWYADDRNGNMYYFNVCGDANKVPEACVAVEKAVQSPAYQISHDSNCFWLGKLRSSEWELIDENEPAAGIELYYFDGEQCANGIARDFRIQLFCDPDAGIGKPLDYFVLEENCHYSVTWPSQYGCPVSSGVLGGGSGALVFFISMALMLYFGGGVAYNVKNGMPFGPEAIPNASFWMSLSQGIASVFVTIKGIVERAIGRGSYQSVDSAQGQYDSY